MKKIIMVLLLLVSGLFAVEPLSGGAYFGNINIPTPLNVRYVSNVAESVGITYLYKRKTGIANHIHATKNSHIKIGLKEAKNHAKDENRRYYAIDNITHEITYIEKFIYISTNFNVIAFN